MTLINCSTDQLAGNKQQKITRTTAGSGSRRRQLATSRNGTRTTTDIDPWTYSPIREAPEFTPRSVRDIDVQTDWETPGPTVDAEQRHQTDGTNSHLQLGDRFMTFARTRGDEISRVE